MVWALFGCDYCSVWEYGIGLATCLAMFCIRMHTPQVKGSTIMEGVDEPLMHHEIVTLCAL